MGNTPGFLAQPGFEGRAGFPAGLRAFSGLQQFEGKVFLWRLATYPVAALTVPVAWAVFARMPRLRRAGRLSSTGYPAGRERWQSYPYPADILLTLPFLIDTAGNSLDLYDTVCWGDDANHLVN